MKILDKQYKEDMTNRIIKALEKGTSSGNFAGVFGTNYSQYSLYELEENRENLL